MYTIKTLNAISPVGLAKLNKNLFDVAVDADAPDGILVRSADLLNTTFHDNLRPAEHHLPRQSAGHRPRRCRGQQHPAGPLQ